MASATPRLKNTLSFAALAPAASVVLVHNLNDGQKALSPDIVYLPNEKLTVTASTDVSVTVRNDGDAPLSGAVLVEAWHTIERAFGDKANVDLTVKPYIVHSDAGDAALVRNPFALPEQWIVEALESSSTGTMDQQVSKNFQGIQMLRAGSLVGIRVRPSQPITDGGATFVPHINGLPVLGLLAAVDSGSAPNGASGVAVPGLIPYAAGDIVTIVYTSGDIDPICDHEAWLEVYEAL